MSEFELSESCEVLSGGNDEATRPTPPSGEETEVFVCEQADKIRHMTMLVVMRFAISPMPLSCSTMMFEPNHSGNSHRISESRSRATGSLQQTLLR